MNCGEIKALLPVYLDGQLASGQHRRIENHLRTCERCRQEAQALQKTWDVLGELKDIQPDPNYRTRFWASVSESAPWHEKFRNEIRALFFNRRFVPALAAAGLILVVSMIATYKYHQQPEMNNYFAELSDVDLEMVEIIELVENYDIIHDIDFLKDLEIIDQLEETDAS
jgi:anti-sigma factor RsiW